MDEQMDGWMDGWKDGKKDGWIKEVQKELGKVEVQCGENSLDFPKVLT